VSSITHLYKAMTGREEEVVVAAEHGAVREAAVAAENGATREVAGADFQQ
jgi:hypothetical protein